VGSIDGSLNDYGIDNMLEIPAFPDNDQYAYRWIRVKVGSEDDVKNINFRLREGWTFVREEDVPTDVRHALVLPVIKSGLAQLNGVIQNGDLALAKIPREKAEGIADAAQRRSAIQMAAVDQRVIAFEDNKGTRHTLRNDSRSRTRVGEAAHFDL
jgi:hypothetical protein